MQVHCFEPFKSVHSSITSQEGFEDVIDDALKRMQEDLLCIEFVKVVDLLVNRWDNGILFTDSSATPNDETGGCWSYFGICEGCTNNQAITDFGAKKGWQIIRLDKDNNPGLNNEDKI